MNWCSPGWPTLPPTNPNPVVFDWVYFQARYPELAGVVGGQSFAAACFTEACGYCDNTGTGPLPSYIGGAAAALPSGGTVVNPLYVALHMLTAHIVKLGGTFPTTSGPNAPPSPLVGRINSAGEGSVNVGAELAGVPGSAAWFTQTQYGLAYWQFVAQYRMFRYRGAPRSARSRLVF